MKSLTLTVLAVGALMASCKTNKTQVSRELSAEEQVIKDYLDSNKIVAVFDDSGLFYVNNGGGTGPKAQKGQKVSVHYTGKLLNGTVFDSSVPRGDPFQFTLGGGMVIKGWDIGLGFFSKGDKGVLYIPSTLGYGTRGAGGAIPPNAGLIFEVELVDIQ